MTVSIYRVIDKLETFVREGTWLPFGHRILSEERLVEYIEKMRSTLPEEVGRAKVIASNKDRMIRDAQEKAEQIVTEAVAQKNELVEGTDVMRQARTTAEIVLREAEEKARRIRAGADAYAGQVLADLEAAFGSPVIEAYGMTEAAHQMACNPLPPATRKPGTVGLAAGPEVAIMDESGKLLEAGLVGEIVIRGDNVTDGYENNPKANAEAFTHGWFRTGDQGVMDAQGYISVTGRLKEIINRGGEKISPREVDEVLMDHPAVQQVVTFGIPHDKLGEEVGAVVVLHEGMDPCERDLRDFVAGRLADYKVPKKILFMAEIPKGATGKLQRIGLAQKLGLG